MDYLDKIFEYAEEVYPQECCGVVAERDGEEKFFPIPNIADDPYSEFEFSKPEYLEVILQNNIRAIVHSHPDGVVEPSNHDIKACNFIKIPYLIVSYPKKDALWVEPGQLNEY